MDPQHRRLARIALSLLVVAAVAVSINYSTESVASGPEDTGAPGSTPLLSPSPTEPPPPPPPEFPPTPVRSRITIRFDEGAGAFKGAVSSKRARCERRRRVIVKRERSGDDRVLGATKTRLSGRWSLGGFEDPRGRYYARTPKKKVEANGVTLVCRAARSRTIQPGS